MSILIKHIKNKPVESNCFVLYQQGKSNCIIVDPGNPDCNELLIFLEAQQLEPEYILLTHEHFDHIWGVKKLKDTFDCKVVCSQDCAVKIVDKKKNMSVFYDRIGFQTYNADIFIEKIDYKLKWNDLILEFIDTKGHTNGCLCILVDNFLFTGDTIINGLKTVTKLPYGNKSVLAASIEYISTKITYPINIKPGHGDAFVLESMEELLAMKLY